MLASGDLVAGLAPLIVAVAVFVLFCLVDAARAQVRGPRWVWFAVIVLFIPLGGVIYLLAGRDQAARTEVAFVPAARSYAPSERGPVWPSSSGGSATENVDRAGSPTTVVATAGLRKTYGTRVALDGVEVEVSAGRVYGLVGPNGAGKTTLIGILSGLRRASAGEVEVAASRVAFMPDTPEFEPWLTAREVVELSRRLMDPAAPVARVDEALDEVGMGAAAQHRVGGFSRGMIQRLGLAATIVGSPDVMLLDEPCSALDPAGRRDVLDLVAEIGRRATVLFSSHILSDVERVCDTVGVLAGGRLRYQGPLQALLGGQLAPSYLVEVRAPVEPVVAALEREDFVDGVEATGTSLRIRVRSLEEAEARLVAALASARAVVVRMEPLARDLESAFLALTAPEPPPAPLPPPTTTESPPGGRAP